MEGIVVLLDLPDICSLRLVAREVCQKASTGIFRTHFRRKKVKLTTEHIRRAISVMQQLRFGCLLEHLTLVAVPALFGPDLQEQENQQNLTHLLQQVLEIMCRNSKRGCLLFITLAVEGAGTDDRNRPSIWDAAATCFEMTVLALGSSKLPIENLDVFGSVTCCSLACDQVAAVLTKANLADSFRGLKRLSLSLSHHEVRQPESEYMQSPAFGRANAEAICQFLQLCPRLTDLQLHWYRTYHRQGKTWSAALSDEMHFFDRITESCRFPCLERLTLKGIYTNGTALASFLRQVQISSLDMQEIHLGSSGAFRPVFDYLSDHMQQLEYLHLDELWESKLINFDAPGKPHFPSIGRGPHGPHAITRTGEDARKVIGYRRGWRSRSWFS
ncbi:hypothetical protein BDZ45DRAFT_729992 [Acephala macrosclerotiorum]|nr:hypothetical protein BDZ45DRAFT_729992 [Acephala macrosclerotiorum]